MSHRRQGSEWRESMCSILSGIVEASNSCASGTYTFDSRELAHRLLSFLRSPLRINNYTNFAMRVLVQVPPPLNALEMTCPERSNAPIPISLAATGSKLFCSDDAVLSYISILEGVIRIAPVAPQGQQVGWLYSDHGLRYQGTVTKPDTKFLTCRWAELPASARAAAVPPPFVLRVAVKGASESRRLLILPPLKLHNLLPVDMSYRYLLYKAILP